MVLLVVGLVQPMLVLLPLLGFKYGVLVVEVLVVLLILPLEEEEVLVVVRLLQ
jgi:hypothetical protein